jgi:Calcineurin-like phosphoesterase
MKHIALLLIWLLCSMRVMGMTYAPSFSFAILPDTQKYARYNIAMFNAQTQWIADHTTSHQIAFTAHLGDVVDKARQDYQWQNADAAMSILDKHLLPYSILAGNHDLLRASQNDLERDSELEPFLRYFPATRIQHHPTYGGHSPSGFNSYFVFEAGGQQFLVLALDWRLADESLLWVQSILDAHADIPTILTTHQLLYVDREGNPRFSRNGTLLWNQIIAPNNQIFLAINGHHYGVTHIVRQNNTGNAVLLMLLDYQADYMGGNGMMRLLTFDLQRDTIHAETFSPYVMSIPPDERDEQDIERKTDAANQFTIELEITGRFAYVPER